MMHVPLQEWARYTCVSFQVRFLISLSEIGVAIPLGARGPKTLQITRGISTIPDSISIRYGNVSDRRFVSTTPLGLRHDFHIG